ncbi:MAG TPA: anthranilate phosphoribosyltransferase [Chthonomonadaceae bacterium]|nr:anthranilate phosphoribosyltransferase [Chthonomonadaceae bacterium]
MPQHALKKIVAGHHLTREEAEEVATLIMDGQATPAQIGAILIALRMKGETVEEVAGFARGMRARVVAVPARRRPLLDTCGTGGSAFRTFNVSTAVAFVAAAAGVAVAKHGNRAITGICGSADVLEALGVRVGLSPEACAACIDDVGVGFLFAPAHHLAMKQVGGPRREVGVRTIFNLLGPLTNPAGATHQVMGVYDAALIPLAVGALRDLGSSGAIVLHAQIGLDEISTIGPTRICELRDGQITETTLTPRDLGLEGPEPCPEDLAPAATPEENAALVREVLAGQADDRPARARRDLVAVNAAAALRVCGLAGSWPEAVRLARQVIASGDALVLLDRLAAFTASLE